MFNQKSFDDLILLAKNKEEMLRSVPAILPISNKGPKANCVQASD